MVVGIYTRGHYPCDGMLLQGSFECKSSIAAVKALQLRLHFSPPISTGGRLCREQLRVLAGAFLCIGLVGIPGCSRCSITQLYMPV